MQSRLKNLFLHNPLFTSFAGLIVMDVIGTVLGQPPEYWSSGYKVINEAAPVFPLLQIHPMVFIVVCLAMWLTFTAWLVKKLPSPWNMWATLSLIIGHGYNSVYWLRVDMYRAGWFTGEDQFTKAVSLLPMTVFVLIMGWVASRGIVTYFKQPTAFSTKSKHKINS